jgi:hypothetical protein
MPVKLSKYQLFFMKMHIFSDYFKADGHSTTSFMSLFMLFDLIGEQRLTAPQLGFLTLIHGEDIVDLMNTWIDTRIVTTNGEGEAQTFHLTIFPEGHEELVELMFYDDQPASAYMKLMSDAKAAMGGNPSTKEVLREAIANWKWLQNQELELEPHSADQNESVPGDETRGEQE